MGLNTGDKQTKDTVKIRDYLLLLFDKSSQLKLFS